MKQKLGYKWFFSKLPTLYILDYESNTQAAVSNACTCYLNI